MLLPSIYHANLFSVCLEVNGKKNKNLETVIQEFCKVQFGVRSLVVVG